MLEINTEIPGKFNPKEATFVNPDGGAHTLTDKAGKLYISAIPQNTSISANTDHILLKDSLMLYFEYFDRTKHIESTISRLRAYAEAIQKLVH
jgi:hypothetical protein